MVKSGKHPAESRATTKACPLCELINGQCGLVVSVGGEDVLRRRLLEMGFCNGVRVRVIRRAPLGDPMELVLRGYSLSLRNEQARHVRVSPG